MRLADFTNLMNGDDVRVIERGGGFGFLDEAPHPVGILRVFGWQELERDAAVEPRVEGEIDLTHPTSAERGDNFVAVETSTRGDSHRWGLPGLLDSGRSLASTLR